MTCCGVGLAILEGGQARLLCVQRLLAPAVRYLISRYPPMTLRYCLLKGLRMIRFQVIQEFPLYSAVW